MANYNVDITQSFGGTLNCSPSSLSGLSAGDTVTFNHLSSSDASAVTLAGFSSGQWTDTSNIFILDGGSEIKTVASPPANTATNTITVSSSGGSPTFTTIDIGIVAGSVEPNQFTFTDVSNAKFLTEYISNTVTLTGITAPSSPVSISSNNVAGLAEWRKNGGSWTSSSGSVVNNDTVQVRLRTTAQENDPSDLTLDVGGITDTYTVTTGTADKTLTVYATQEGPSYAYFAVLSDEVIQGESLKVIHSTASPSGIPSISVSGFSPTAWETANTGVVLARGSYSCRESRTTANEIDTVTIQVTGAPNSISRAIPVLPPAIRDPDTPTAFDPITVDYPDTMHTSNPETITGITRPCEIVVTNCAYSLNNGITWWTSEIGRPQAVNNDTIIIRAYSGSNFSSVVTPSITIGESSDIEWQITVRSSLDANELITTQTTRAGFSFREDVQEFFAGNDIVGPVTAATKLSEFTRGSVYIPDIPENNAIPTSAVAGMSEEDFIGASTYLTFVQGGADRSKSVDTSSSGATLSIGWALTGQNPHGSTFIENPRIGYQEILGATEQRWILTEDSTYDTGLTLTGGVTNTGYGDNNYTTSITQSESQGTEKIYKGTVTLYVRHKVFTSKVVSRSFRYSLFFIGP